MSKKRKVKKPAKKGTIPARTIKKAVANAKKKRILPKGTKGAPKGNQFWRARSSHGRKPKFKTPAQLWNACCEYFDWIEANPLQEEKIFCFQGDITKATINKMRAMTISGLCIFLDISETTWGAYRANKDLLAVVTRAERIIYNQKFAGASADLLNANIIARDLGLKDKKEITAPEGVTFNMSFGGDKKDGEK